MLLLEEIRMLLVLFVYELRFKGFEGLGFCTFSAYGIPPSRRLSLHFYMTASNGRKTSGKEPLFQIDHGASPFRTSD
jgi:hypothetical protein